MAYRRNFGDVEREGWSDMMGKLDRINLSEEDDRVIWHVTDNFRVQNNLCDHK